MSLNISLIEFTSPSKDSRGLPIHWAEGRPPRIFVNPEHVAHLTGDDKGTMIHFSGAASCDADGNIIDDNCIEVAETISEVARSLMVR